MLNWLKPRNWGIVKVYHDFENFLDWRRVIKMEEARPNSKFNLWKLQRTQFYDIYITVSLDEADAQLPENIKRVKVIESLNMLNRYFDEELGFAECLDIEFNQFEDDERNLTLTYLIVYRFSFKKFSIKWLLKFLIINSILAFIIIRYDLIALLTAWVSSLI